MKAEKYIARFMEKTYGREPKVGRRYRPGLCTECLRPKTLCWATGEEKDAATSAKGKNK